MKKNKILIPTLTIIISLIVIFGNVSTAQLKASTINDPQIINETEYSIDKYLEGIDIRPLKGTAVGINAGFIGGTVNLPFDVTTYNKLVGLTFIAANQKAWRDYSQRRFWDVADGASLALFFRGITVDDALDQGREIADMMESAYNTTLYLVFGHWDRDLLAATLVYQGAMNDLEGYIEDYVNYIPDEGFGEGVTADILQEAPVKAMGISLLNSRIPEIGIITRQWIPVLDTAWIDPDGLEQTGTIIDMNLTSLMPNLSAVEGKSDSIASVVSMKLPYVVDVLEIDPPTDNMYPHLKGEFEWVVKVDFGLFQRNVSYSDIYVSYDLNLSDLKNYPEVVGEMSLNSSLPFDGSQDIELLFNWENVGVETAYNITLTYGEFKEGDLNGTKLLVQNPDLTFNDTYPMYYRDSDGLVTNDSSILVPGTYATILGWFYNETSEDWLGNGEYHPGSDFDTLLSLAYVEDTFLELDYGDFERINLTETGDLFTLGVTIDSLDPGENVSKSFAVRNLPSGTVNIYNSTDLGGGVWDLNVEDSPNWEEYFAILMRIGGSSLHIPEDQVTYLNWFPQEVIGSTYIYEDAEGKELMGLTNGLVIQVYDDEAVLVGKVTLDKEIYRFGEEAMFTLELENIGNANATNVDYMFYHAFVTDNFELGYIEDIVGSNGTVPLIKPGEKVTVTHNETVKTHIGLHPVFAMFGYTSDEPGIDPRDVQQPFPWYISEDIPDTIEQTINDAVYATPVFNTTIHNRVISSMDFGMVLPPLNKEGTTKPTYPTPEVEVTSELIGITEETEIGDEVILRTNITNLGDESTNIIYIQRIPSSLKVITGAGAVNITVDGVPITNWEPLWLNNPTFGFPIGMLAQEFNADGAFGIPLGVNETMIIEVHFTIQEEGEIFVPPAEIRYRSEHNMTARQGINDEVGAPEEETSVLPTGLHATNLGSEIMGVYLGIEEEAPSTGEASTNNWGSYSDSLTIVIESIQGLNLNYIYVGVGLIAVTGVAVIIYFNANGKRKR